MTSTITPDRAGRLALAAALGAAVALLFTASSTQAAPSSQALTPKAVALTRAMDELWEQHVAWTRMAIVSFAGGLPDLQATEARLLRNQTDIGNAIKPFYGAAAGAQLTRLLRTHILEAVTVLGAVKAASKARLAAATKAWYANARQIAGFLSKANPKSWPLPATTAMMNEHLKLTTQEALDELGGRFAASARDYDRVETEILMMADTLASGIVDQFPARFA